MSSSKNLEYKKTSFLSKSNSAFIEQMYLKFINKDSNLPESWKKYFIEIGEEFEVVAKEINGPSWNPIKKKVNLDIIQENFDKDQNNLPKGNIKSAINKIMIIPETRINSGKNIKLNTLFSISYLKIMNN